MQEKATKTKQKHIYPAEHLVASSTKTKACKRKQQRLNKSMQEKATQTKQKHARESNKD